MITKLIAINGILRVLKCLIYKADLTPYSWRLSSNSFNRSVVYLGPLFHSRWNQIESANVETHQPRFVNDLTLGNTHFYKRNKC